jgi:hypothetical protein
MTWELAESGKHFVTTIVNGADLVPTVSTASIDDLRSEVAPLFVLFANRLHVNSHSRWILNALKLDTNLSYCYTTFSLYCFWTIFIRKEMTAYSFISYVVLVASLNARSA